MGIVLRDQKSPLIGELQILIGVAILVAKCLDLFDRHEDQKGPQDESSNGCDSRSGGGLTEGDKYQRNGKPP